DYAMPNYAVIDLGSNSIRLVVYDVKDAHKRTCTNKDFKSLINDKVMAGLSAYVVDGVFTQDGIDRAVSVLRGHAKRARYFDCEKMEVFATAVIRNALNCEEAVAAIEEAAELPISLLSATDEAHLGFVGATCDRAEGARCRHRRRLDRAHTHRKQPRFRQREHRARVVVIVRPARTRYPADPGEMDAIAEAFRKRFAGLLTRRVPLGSAVGIGGSVRAAAKMHARHRRGRTSENHDETATMRYLHGAAPIPTRSRTPRSRLRPSACTRWYRAASSSASCSTHAEPSVWTYASTACAKGT
ncbi:MAG: hypothetical protein ACLSVD_19645, partial [Eggerthellaceae bacterium]